METARTRDAAPLLSPTGALLALLGALVLCWPMIVTGQIFFVSGDTANYISGGETVWRLFLDMLAPASDAEGGGPSLANPDGEPYFVRSFAYSLYSFSAVELGGPFLLALGQAWVTLMALFGLVGASAWARRGILLAGFAVLAGLTTLPWLAVYLMPDLLTAVIIIHAAVLLRRFDALGTGQRVLLCALCAFAVIAHYGNPPVAAGLFAAVLLWRLLRRNLTAATLVGALVPVLLSPAANLTASSVVLDQPSTAPLRLPILLARSIEDGPARWYLAEACPEADLALCDAFGDEVPSNIPAFLWLDGGIGSLTPEQVERIRREEFTVLSRAFLAYPVAQATSVLRNGFRQAAAIGLAGGNIEVGSHLGENYEPDPAGGLGLRLLPVFDVISTWVTWGAGLALLLLLLLGRLSPPKIEIVAVVALGLLINAFVFGGLSAPAERYQARVIWLLPALLALFLAERAAARPGPAPAPARR